MRVAHICEAFSPLSETFIYDQIVELETQGEECHVITLRRDNETSRPFPRVHTIQCPWSPRRIRDRMLVSLGQLDRERYLWPYLRPQLEHALRKIKPDVIHAHFGPMGACIARVANALRIPLTVSFYGFDTSVLPRDNAWRRLLQDTFAQADAIVALSQVMKRQLEQLGSAPGRTHIIHLGKRLDEFPYSAWDGRPIKHWISVGRLTEKKGHKDAIQAFQKIAALDLSSTLTIIGEGEDHATIAAYVSRTGLHDRIKLLGALSNHETRNRMLASDAFILCSKTASNGDSEGTPTVLLEAQALGLPCISTTHSGIPEVIPTQSNWLLAGEGDINGLFDRMHRLIHCNADEVSQIVSAGRAIVEANFDIARETEQLRALFTLMAAKASGTSTTALATPFDSNTSLSSMPTDSARLPSE